MSDEKKLTTAFGALYRIIATLQQQANVVLY